MGTPSMGNPAKDAVGSAGVVVPVKAFSRAKQRLAPQLSPSERAELARVMAAHVVSVAEPFEVFVVCDDDEVASWAIRLSARTIMCPGAGLNLAVAQGVEHLRLQGFNRAIIAHGDLPFASGFEQFANDGAEVSIAPDRWENGTNVLSVPTDSNFTFSYGPRSFHRHTQEAKRLSLPLIIHRDTALAWDIDLPRDLKAEALAQIAAVC